MANVAHMGSVEEMTVAIKETVDFGWIGSSGCSPQTENSIWYCERCHKNCYSMVVQAKKQVIE